MMLICAFCEVNEFCLNSVDLCLPLGSVPDPS
jgi:hypothetical protein